MTKPPVKDTDSNTPEIEKLLAQFPRLQHAQQQELLILAGILAEIGCGAEQYTQNTGKPVPAELSPLEAYEFLCEMYQHIETQALMLSMPDTEELNPAEKSIEWARRRVAAKYSEIQLQGEWVCVLHLGLYLDKSHTPKLSVSWDSPKARGWEQAVYRKHRIHPETGTSQSRKDLVDFMTKNQPYFMEIYRQNMASLPISCITPLQELEELKQAPEETLDKYFKNTYCLLLLVEQTRKILDSNFPILPRGTRTGKHCIPTLKMFPQPPKTNLAKYSHNSKGITDLIVTLGTSPLPELRLPDNSEEILVGLTHTDMAVIEAIGNLMDRGENPMKPEQIAWEMLGKAEGETISRATLEEIDRTIQQLRTRTVKLEWSRLQPLKINAQTKEESNNLKRFAEQGLTLDENILTLRIITARDSQNRRCKAYQIFTYPSPYLLSKAMGYITISPRQLLNAGNGAGKGELRELQAGAKARGDTRANKLTTELNKALLRHIARANKLERLEIGLYKLLEEIGENPQGIEWRRMDRIATKVKAICGDLCKAGKIMDYEIGDLAGYTGRKKHEGKKLIFTLPPPRKRQEKASKKP